eukprot:1182875-Prorocentrum_minimum.AAC.2
MCPCTRAIVRLAWGYARVVIRWLAKGWFGHSAPPALLCVSSPAEASPVTSHTQPWDRDKDLTIQPKAKTAKDLTKLGGSLGDRFSGNSSGGRSFL